MRLRLVVGLLLVALAAPFGARDARGDDACEAALERSLALEREGRYAEGVDLLSRARASYPQDYAVALRLAWLSFLAGRYEDAERAYRDAVHLSAGQSAEARSGLGWSLLRMGRKAEAARELEAALALSPADPTAAEGHRLALAPEPPSFELFPSFAVVGHAYPSHPYKSFAGTLAVGASALLIRHVYVGATYRGSLFAFDPPPGEPRRGSSSFAQHEGHFTAGWVSMRAAALAHVALLEDGSGFSGSSQHVGATARYSPWGDGVVAGSYSRYPDMDVGRAELSWRLPLGERAWVRPAGAIQRAASETLVTGYATAGYDGPRAGAWLGGKLGDEVRPAYLGVPFVLNVPERVVYGGWGGVWTSLGERWRASLALDVHVLERTDGLTPTKTASLFAALGVARTL